MTKSTRTVVCLLTLGGLGFLTLGLWTASQAPILESWVAFERNLGRLKLADWPNRDGRQTMWLDLNSGQISIDAPTSRAKLLEFPQYRARVDLVFKPGKQEIDHQELVIEDDLGPRTLAFESSPNIFEMLSPTELLYTLSDSRIVLHDVQQATQLTFQASTPGAPVRLLAAKESRSFLYVSEPTTSPRALSVELFKLDSSGKPQSIWTRPLNFDQGVFTADGVIYLLSPNPSQIDRFDADSGSQLPGLPFPNEAQQLISQKSGPVGIVFREGHLAFYSIQLGHLFYEFPSLKKLDVEFRYYYPVKLNDCPQLLAVVEYPGEVLHVYDRSSMKPLWKMSAEGLIAYGQHADKLARVYDRMGYTIEVVDVVTGNVVHRFVPFGWLAWVLPTLVLGGGWWAWAVGKRINVLNSGTSFSGTKQWFGWAILSIVLLLPLTLHLSRWGYSSHAVYTHQYVQGFFTGSIPLAFAWIVWGNGRLIERCLPLLIILIALAILARTLLGSLSLQSEAIFSTLAATLPVLFVFLIARWILSLTMRQADNKVHRPWKMPMRDTFLWSGAIAILVSAMLPVIRNIQGLPSDIPPNLSWMVGMEIAAIFGFGTALLLSSKNWGRMSWIFLMLLLAAITVESLYGFVSGRPLVPRNHFPCVLFRITTTAVVVFLVGVNCLSLKAVPRLATNPRQ